MLRRYLWKIICFVLKIPLKSQRYLFQESIRDGYTNKEDVWIKLITLSGELKLIFLNKHLEVEQEVKCNSTNNNTYLVNPNSTFRITPKSNDLEFILEYYCEAQDYFSNKYNLSPAHEEVVSAVKHIPPVQGIGFRGWSRKEYVILIFYRVRSKCG